MKFCTHCGAEVVEGAVVCIKCGCSVGKPPIKAQTNSQIEHSSGNTSDVFIFLFAVILILSFIILIIMRKFVPGFQRSPIAYVYNIITIIQYLSYFLPVFAIKNKVLKIVGAIIVAIPVIYRIIDIVKVFGFARFF